MTLTLTYDQPNGRIGIDADQLYDATSALVERSIDQIKWKTVRGGAEVEVIQGGLDLPGGSGNYASTPDNAALDITGDISLRADATLDDWSSGSVLIGKWTTTGNQRSYRLEVFTDGLLYITWSTAGSASISLASDLLVTDFVVDGARLAVRADLDVNNGAGGHTATFYIADTIDGPWFTFGDPVIGAGVTSIFSSTAVLEAGSSSVGTADIVQGVIHAAEVYNSSGALVASPRFNEQDGGTNSFTDSSGRVWTINNSADIVETQFAEVLYDYEFTAGVTNYYRVFGNNTMPISFVSAGTASSGSSGSRTPAMPAGVTAGHEVYILASTRNSGTGTVDTPTNWTVLAETGNFKLMSRTYDGVWVMPTVTFTGGAVNEDTIAQSMALRHVNPTPQIAANTQLNSSAQNIAHGALTVQSDDLLLLAAGWKQDDYTSVAPLSAPSTWTEIQEASSTAGNDASQIWDYLIQVSAASVVAASFTVTGGASAISRSLIMGFAESDSITEQTANVTPEITGIWIKSVLHPFLNIFIAGGCTAVGDNDTEMLVSDVPVRRAARTNVFPIVNRTYGIAVNDIRVGRDWTYRIRTHTHTATVTLDYLLASGDILFIQVPPPCDETIPHGYVTAYDASYVRPHSKRTLTTVWEIPVQEVAPPGPDIVYAALTWQTVIDAYADWDAVIAANPTWADLLELLPDPSEVIVP